MEEHKTGKYTTGKGKDGEGKRKISGKVLLEAKRMMKKWEEK